MSGESGDDFEKVKDRARAWISQDPNPVTAKYVQNLLADRSDDKQQQHELRSLFPLDDKRLAFGTAGLRSRMAPGPLHMNDLVVIQAAQGIAAACRNANKKTNVVVIGYDHRACDKFNLSSVRFAVWTALVFQQSGVFDDILLLDGYVATPLVPFGILNSNSKNCTIGIMITASHNPKEDAGYKVYWNNGCQICAPIDQKIATAIQQNLTPWIDYGARLEELVKENNNTSTAVHGDPRCCGLSDPQRTRELIDKYFETIKSRLVTGQATSFDSKKPKPVFCYTALHGIGYPFAKRSIMDTFGVSEFHSVPAQQEPDAEFSTVSFPNPEEDGALDLAKAYAVANNCNVILANDPDADRLAVAERTISNDNKDNWTIFTGDQIGTMLGHWMWQQNRRNTDSNNAVLAMLGSTVSSKMLAEIARVEGFYFEDTLTGFKWIGSRAAQLHGTAVPTTRATDGSNNKTYKCIFCYEEAIGFCCGDIIFDKDGISALGVFAELCYSVYSRGMTLQQHMQSLYDTYGEFVSNNGYFFMQDNSFVGRIFDRITHGGDFDALLDQGVGAYPLTSVRYLGEPGYDSQQADKKPRLPCSKSSPMITLRFANGCVAQFRASGTEPKFKYYIELKGAPGVSRADVSQELDKMSSVLLQELLEPEKNGLRRSKL